MVHQAGGDALWCLVVAPLWSDAKEVPIQAQTFALR